MPTFIASQRNQGNFRKASEIDCFIDYVKAFVWITAKCGKFLKRWEYQTTFTCLLRNLYADQEITGHRTIDWIKIGKEVRAGYIL